MLAEQCFDPIADEFLDDYYYITPSISQQHLLAKILQGGIINNLKQLTINEDFSAIVELFRCYLPNNRIQTLIVYPGGVPLPKVPKCQNSNDGTFGTPDRKRWNFWNF